MSETAEAIQSETASQTQAETPAPAATILAPEPAVAAPVVPDKYEFTAPEIDGKAIDVDADALTGFETAAREVGLTQEQFAKIAPLGAQLIAQKVGAAIAAAVPEYLRPETQTAWQTAIRGDAEIGGDKLAPSLAQAAKVIDQFGGTALRDALNLTRAGNNPAIVKAFVAIGKAMGDAEGFRTGKPAVAAKSASAEERARNFYNQNGGSYPPLEG